MRYDTEELVCIADEVKSTIKIAISELEGVKEYSEVMSILEDSKSELENLSARYEEKLMKEQEKELEYMNREYERSVI